MTFDDTSTWLHSNDYKYLAPDPDINRQKSLCGEAMKILQKLSSVISFSCRFHCSQTFLFSSNLLCERAKNEYKAKSSQFSYGLRLVVWVSVRIKPNFRIIPSKNCCFFSVFIARKEGQSFVRNFFFYAFNGKWARVSWSEKLVENMSQNHHNLITSSLFSPPGL